MVEGEYNKWEKKLVAILLIATMAMGIAACGGSGDKKGR